MYGFSVRYLVIRKGQAIVQYVGNQALESALAGKPTNLTPWLEETIHVGSCSFRMNVNNMGKQSHPRQSLE